MAAARRVWLEFAYDIAGHVAASDKTRLLSREAPTERFTSPTCYFELCARGY
jgi:hypothetical protein